ncbi:MAG: polyphosphate kinase 2 family protein [Chloroflexi bacterium]|nr:MAG: polyphosphate kinase 2 family protein [Chloroflexota bacterium]
MPVTHRLVPERPIRLTELPTRGQSFYPAGKEAAKAEFRALRKELAELQYRFYADGRFRLLIILQAMDAGGKDGTIRRVFQGVNPQGVRVTSFKVPSKEELAHDFLWRIHKAVPGNGMIGIFNRSHYEDVLVVRVHNLVPESVWRPRYEQINQFEKMLTETGTTILKFYLHISKEEQKQRFQERVDNPEKHWKFSHDDLKKRALWDAYMAAYEEALNRCTTPWAPWYVIPADQKWYRNLAIARVIVDTIKQLDPQFPPPEGDLSQVVIE